ncbi:Colicin I receptor [Dissostichus eleginoides]|uniref:Colicin I receptor n=1 Tax=Dissostichus eleginoides TaxID=100907 RepID=A0AAD9B6F5_DISEL|nr:Colicin I receptor [Dissostichus eleginoides]
MMKMLGGVTWCCVALLLALTSVSAVQKTLKSINGLKKINFGQSVPKHSLLLLHWFANQIDIDNNDIIQLTFDPNSGEYGSHHYGNYERCWTHYLGEINTGTTRLEISIRERQSNFLLMLSIP